MFEHPQGAKTQLISRSVVPGRNNGAPGQRLKRVDFSAISNFFINLISGKVCNQANNDWPILVQKFDTLKILASFAHRLR